MHQDDRHDEFRPVIERLRADRPTATPLELDATKQRVLARVARPRPTTRRSFSLMRTRAAILSMLALGFLLSTTGVGLAVSGLSDNNQASSAQYGPTPTPTSTNTPPPTSTPTSETPPATSTTPPTTTAPDDHDHGAGRAGSGGHHLTGARVQRPGRAEGEQAADPAAVGGPARAGADDAVRGPARAAGPGGGLERAAVHRLRRAPGAARRPRPAERRPGHAPQSEREGLIDRRSLEGDLRARGGPSPSLRAAAAHGADQILRLLVARVEAPREPRHGPRVLA